jgi:hypothetical protein
VSALSEPKERAEGSGPGVSPAPRPRTPSWWTARATEAEVRGGFTKEEILKPAKEDPRAPGGVFERVGGLLEALFQRT